MNYLKIYKSLIRDRKLKPAYDGYTETHHILPKSLGGGNEKENLIILSARDHFLAHKLLAKIYGGPMNIAIWIMCQKGTRASKKIIVTSRQFATAREGFAKEMSKRLKGVSKPDWVRKKLSESLKGRVFTQEWKDNISKGQKGSKKKPLSENHKKSISKRMMGSGNHRYGKPCSEKQKQAVRIANSGKKSHLHNEKIYVFINESGQIKKCTQYDLRMEFNLNHGNLSMVCSGDRKSVSGWRLFNES